MSARGRVDKSNTPNKLTEKSGIPTNTDAWIQIREARVRDAIASDDIASLREISALPGGFGSDDMRKIVWPILLRTERFLGSSHAEGSSSPRIRQEKSTAPNQDEVEEQQIEDDGSDLDDTPPPEAEVVPHKDEHQVKLDTLRSFVTYPRGLPAESKLKLQQDLHELIVGVLRRYPALHYFQGYHDILSVLYLTYLPPRSAPRSRSRSPSNDGLRRRRGSHAQEESDKPDSAEKESLIEEKPHESPPPPYEDVDRETADWAALRQCAEAVSLNRVRDAMGTGMEGMMGLLRILKRILRAADPELSRFSALISPVPTLPFFALSWVLTLFSHDCDSLEPVQRMFDFLLARNPISAVYLAAAILIAKKPQMFDMAKKLGSEYRDDPSLLHPLFVRLPPLYPDTPSSPDPPSANPQKLSQAALESNDEEANPYKPIRLSELFSLTDKLLAQYPWDGDVIRGKEILGAGSVVQSYDLEMASQATPATKTWSPADAIALIDRDVVLPGAGSAMDDDDDEDEEEEEEEVTPSEARRKRIRRIPISLRLPRNKLSTILAVGVMVVGMGMAVYGIKAGGPEASWGRWWAVVVRAWAGKEGRRVAELSNVWSRVIAYLGRSIREL